MGRPYCHSNGQELSLAYDINVVTYPQANNDVHFIKQGSKATFINVRANDNTTDKQITVCILHHTI